MPILWIGKSTCIYANSFIKGGNSSYIKIENSEKILEQFPNATAFTINGSGHWVHAEKPDFVIRAIKRFLNKN